MSSNEAILQVIYLIQNEILPSHNTNIRIANVLKMMLAAMGSFVGTIFRPMGSVPTYNDLPSNPTIGDVYTVNDTSANWVYGATGWFNVGTIFKLASAVNDGLLSKEMFSQIGNLGNIYATKTSVTDLSTLISQVQRALTTETQERKNTDDELLELIHDLDSTSVIGKIPEIYVTIEQNIVSKSISITSPIRINKVQFCENTRTDPNTPITVSVVDNDGYVIFGEINENGGLTGQSSFDGQQEISIKKLYSTSNSFNIIINGGTIDFYATKLNMATA